MEQSKNMHRVGTLTASILLILVGVLFLLHTIVPAINYLVIFNFWPCILIFLGLEMLYANFRKEEIIYDKGAIFLVILLALFAMGMGGADLVIKHLIEQGYVCM